MSNRSIDDLRPDVAANYRIGSDLCRNIGVPVKVSCTLRTQAEQTALHLAGKAPATVAFHGCGLAFDMYVDIVGMAYDTTLIAKAAACFKKVGFTWMYDIIKSDGCHFQWDNRRDITTAEVIAGQRPPDMPIYKERDIMSQFIENMAVKYKTSTVQIENALEELLKLPLHIPADWEKKGEQILFTQGLTHSVHSPNEIVTFGILGTIEGKRK